MRFFAEFLKDRIYPIIWSIAAVAVCVIVFWLHDVKRDALFYSIMLCLVLAVVVLTLDFVREFRRHRARLRRP